MRGPCPTLWTIRQRPSDDFLIHHHPDMREISRQVPGDEVARAVVGCLPGNREFLAFAREEHHQVRHAAMVDVGVEA